MAVEVRVIGEKCSSSMAVRVRHQPAEGKPSLTKLRKLFEYMLHQYFGSDYICRTEVRRISDLLIRVNGYGNGYVFMGPLWICFLCNRGDSTELTLSRLTDPELAPLRSQRSRLDRSWSIFREVIPTES